MTVVITTVVTDTKDQLSDEIRSISKYYPNAIFEYWEKTVKIAKYNTVPTKKGKTNKNKSQTFEYGTRPAITVHWEV